MKRIIRKKPKKSGPKPIKINWEEVEHLCKIQCTKDEIASFLGVSEWTLRVHAKKDHKCTFGELRKKWGEGGKCSLRRKQWLLADKNATMAIFLGKQMLNQQDDIRLNHGGIVQKIIHYGDGTPTTWEDEQKNKQDEKKDE